MAKKGNLVSLYLIGMALVVIGFICPMFTGFLGSANGFKFINFDNSGFVTIGALLVIAGAIFGLLCALVPSLGNMKMIALCVTVVGGIVLVLGFTTNGGIYKVIGKGLLKHATYGFYIVIVGWIAAIAGYVTGK